MLNGNKGNADWPWLLKNSKHFNNTKNIILNLSNLERGNMFIVWPILTLIYIVCKTKIKKASNIVFKKYIDQCKIINSGLGAVSCCN